MSNWIQGAVPKKNEGKFTAQAKGQGEGVQEYARQVLAKGSDASTMTKRRAVFAENMKKIAGSHRAVAMARKINKGAK